VQPEPGALVVVVAHRGYGCRAWSGPITC
jgi:hypothetical protein